MHCNLIPVLRQSSHSHQNSSTHYASVIATTQNDKSVTALGIAVGFNRKEMVSWLISKGADVMLVDGKGNTVLHYAAGEGIRSYRCKSPFESSEVHNCSGHTCT